VTPNSISVWAGIAVVVCGLIGGGYAFADRFGFRPALISELRKVEIIASTTATQLMWLQLDQYERIKKRRKLTPRECARYLRIARSLGVPARC
jgi:hypothetical protein